MLFVVFTTRLTDGWFAELRPQPNLLVEVALVSYNPGAAVQEDCTATLGSGLRVFDGSSAAACQWLQI